MFLLLFRYNLIAVYISSCLGISLNSRILNLTFLYYQIIVSYFLKKIDSMRLDKCLYVIHGAAFEKHFTFKDSKINHHTDLG